MKMWFAPGSDVPLYRQMGTHIVLAILSGDLKPGEKLPSTSSLANCRSKVPPSGENPLG